MIQTKFGFHWSSTFRGEDFWKSLRRTTDDDDGRQVMAIAHMTLWVRWAKNDLYKEVTEMHIFDLLGKSLKFNKGKEDLYTSYYGNYDICL
jgi:hypothetical protein